MKIKRKDLLAWVSAKETIRYRGELYKAQYNGLRYYLMPFNSPLSGKDCIDFYHKGRGVYGLTDNKA